MIVASGCASPEDQKVSRLLERQKASAVYRVGNLGNEAVMLTTPGGDSITIGPGEITSQLKQASGKAVTLGLALGTKSIELNHTFGPKEETSFLVLQGAGGLIVERHTGELLGTETDQVVRTVNLTKSPVTVKVELGDDQDEVGPVRPGTEAERRVSVTVGEEVRVRLGQALSPVLPVREQDSFAAVVFDNVQGGADVVLLRTRVKSVPVAAGGS
jgi:hypothetical protein